MRHRPARLLAVVLGLLMLLAPAAAHRPAAAQSLVPGGETAAPAAPAPSWLDVNRGYRCGRMWCSAVVFPHDVLDRRRLTLAIVPGAEMGPAAASLAAQERAQTVQVSVDGVVRQLRRVVSGQVDDLPPDLQPEATAERVRALRQAAGMATPEFWSFLQRKPLHPLTPTVTVGFRNKATVIFVPASPELSLGPVTLLTVTEPDAVTAGTDERDLAERWSTVLQQVISESLWGMEFNRSFPPGRALLALLLGTAVTAVLLLVSGLRRSMRAALGRLRRQEQELRESATRTVMAAYAGNRESPDAGAGASSAPDAAAPEAEPPEAEPPEPEPQEPQRSGPGPSSPRRGRFSRLLRRVERQPRRLIRSLPIPYLQQQGWRSQAINLLELGMLSSTLLQLTLVVGGLGAMAAFFPSNRITATLLMKQSLMLPITWLAVIVLRWLLVLAIDHSVNNWLIEATIRNPQSRRYELRAVTNAKLFRNLATMVCIAIGVVVTLVVLGIDRSLLTGASVVAVALSLLLRNLLEDFMQGIVIICTDRFAVGDVVGIPPHSGFVENMNLFNTQLRGIDGELTSLPNGQIRAVENLTKDWSRVNFTIEVAPRENLRAVLELIRAVAEDLRRDPDWADQVIGPPEVLGVDEVRQSGCLIRVWIQTQPLAQWPVGREFRLRVKEAFDREGIRLGLPRQELVLNEALSPSTSP
ncbi:mechanosensitive ion channel family protein [Cyanobium sp. CH-040]|uniref:mechanosensitive ion channel family protein n=1 Tax=Cyanobium sp. CH-040 TaxID=2823708 RepID=UPI0020CD16BB|nr:mechanosensitive ion channel domain-containing protein [Cyanobium sp. CH-040]MCP9927870.1 mechanosensitive ion channel [Cyanobium sp. CH-040]